jgi:hypothetical protein
MSYTIFPEAMVLLSYTEHLDESPERFICKLCFRAIQGKLSGSFFHSVLFHQTLRKVSGTYGWIELQQIPFFGGTGICTCEAGACLGHTSSPTADFLFYFYTVLHLFIYLQC